MASNFVDVDFDSGALQAQLEQLGSRAPLAMSRALNRAGTSGRAAMVKELKRETGIASKNIRKAIVLDRAKRSRPRLKVDVKGRRIPLIAFNAKGPEPSRGKGKGVSFRTPAGRGRASHAFIATMPSGHRGVFERSSRGTRSRKGRPRSSPGLPIKELFGPSVVDLFRRRLPTFVKAAQESFLKAIQREIAFVQKG